MINLRVYRIIKQFIKLSALAWDFCVCWRRALGRMSISKVQANYATLLAVPRHPTSNYKLAFERHYWSALLGTWVNSKIRRLQRTYLMTAVLIGTAVERPVGATVHPLDPSKTPDSLSPILRRTGWEDPSHIV